MRFVTLLTAAAAHVPGLDLPHCQVQPYRIVGGKPPYRLVPDGSPVTAVNLDPVGHAVGSTGFLAEPSSSFVGALFGVVPPTSASLQGTAITSKKQRIDDQHLAIQLDGMTIGTFAVKDGLCQNYTTPRFTTTAGNHTITIQSEHTIAGDNTAL